MTLAAVLGAACALGVLGLIAAVRRRRPSLSTVARAVAGPPPDTDRTAGPSKTLVTAAGEVTASWLVRGPVSRSSGWQRVVRALAVTDRDLVAVASASLIGGGLGLLAPLLVWLGAGVAGVEVPLVVAALAAVLLGAFGLARPCGDLLRAADRRRHHVVVVLGSFVDLVALGLAGGVGIEGALLAAASVSDDWFARRLHRTLSSARDRGTSPWAALGDLGRRLGVDELVELTSTLQLAGTEGSRIRQALAARSVALRRHIQAGEESAANAVTERLFFPGALLLLGFLLFIGYPAVSHVLGGF